MRIERLAIPEVVLLFPEKFGDERGYFVETFNQQRFDQLVEPVTFVQDNEALSAQKGTLRGLHFQKPPMAQGKLVRVIKGAILDVAVDIRAGSPTFGRHVAARLDAKEGAQIYVPPGFAHGYCTLEPDTMAVYKVTAFYSPADDAGILWNDPALSIDWGIGPGDAILSAKDMKLPRLAETGPVFTYTAPGGRP